MNLRLDELAGALEAPIHVALRREMHDGIDTVVVEELATSLASPMSPLQNEYRLSAT
jgi:hypothetical protein